MSLLTDLAIPTCRVSFGKEASFAGTQAKVSIAVTAKALGVAGPLDLRWIATGDLLSSFIDQATTDAGEAGFIDLPQSGQDGFARGTQLFKDWYYYAEVSRSIGAAVLPPRKYRFQIPAGVTALDLDALDEDGQVTAQPAVAPIPVVTQASVDAQLAGVQAAIAAAQGSAAALAIVFG